MLLNSAIQAKAVPWIVVLMTVISGQAESSPRHFEFSGSVVP